MMERLIMELFYYGNFYLPTELLEKYVEDADKIVRSLDQVLIFRKALNAIIPTLKPQEVQTFRDAVQSRFRSNLSITVVRSVLDNYEYAQALQASKGK